jgi:hypothetical protein
MLKLTYTENGFYLERLAEPLEAWISARVLLCLRAAIAICVEPTTASFLLPADLPELDNLKVLARENEEILAVSPCDAQDIEVSLQGTWLGSDSDSEEGIFVCGMSDRAESFLYQLWQEAQIGASVISE